MRFEEAYCDDCEDIKPMRWEAVSDLGDEYRAGVEATCRECGHIGPSLFTTIADSEGIAELIERLVVANLKLYQVCNDKAHIDELPESAVRTLVGNDLALCKSRAAIRAEINRRLGCEVSGESVKNYGKEQTHGR